MRTPEDVCKKALAKGISLSIRAPLGNPEFGSFTGDAERQLNVVLEKQRLCLWEHSEGNLKDRLLYWEL